MEMVLTSSTICELCASVERLRKEEQEAGPDGEFREWTGGAGACRRCGRSLSSSDLFSRLAMFARFGLTGERLLARRRA